MCFIAIQVAMLFYLVLNLAEGIYVAYITIKKEGYKKGRLSCMQILTIPCQNGGMDFESDF